jgi:hypothetical protein
MDDPPKFPRNANRLETCSEGSKGVSLNQKMLRRMIAASPIVLVAVACASPTLPLPPPLVPTISAGPDADHLKLTATCNYPERNSVIIVINENPGVPPGEAVGGALTDMCGAWSTIVFAHTGDLLDITYQLDGTVISQPAFVHVP